MADVYDGKTLQDLFRDIVGLSTSKHAMIGEIVQELRGFVMSKEDVVIVAPIIGDYIDLMIKNDEHLIKVGAIVQRVTQAENAGKTAGGIEEFGLSDEEKEFIFKTASAEADAKKLEAPAQAVKDKLTNPSK